MSRVGETVQGKLEENYILGNKVCGALATHPTNCVSRRLRCMFHSGAGETRRMRMKPIIYGLLWRPLSAR